MKILAFVIGALILLVIGVVVAGYRLPVKHTASRERSYPVPAESVFAAISNTAAYPRWRSGLERVEQLPSDNGHERFREFGSDGAITFEVLESEPGRRMVTRIADTNLAFGGRWTYELSPSGGSTQLRITEDGEVYNPLFRFMSRFVFGHHATIDRYLTDLGTHLERPR
jgi:uncharacterized protein YndB with AHSA1/START domain